MWSIRNPRCPALFACVLSLSAGATQAQLIPDGSFEDAAAPGLSPAWTGVGDAGTVVSPLSGVWPASDGAQFAVMTTAPAVDPVEGGFGDPLPGLPIFGLGVPAATLAAGLGLEPGELGFLDSFGGAIEGSGILSAPFVVLPNQSTLLFDFQFVSNEPPTGFEPFPDTAFVSVDGGPASLLNDATAAVFPSGSPLFFVRDAGPFVTAGILLDPGLHTIAFGVVDVGDGDVSSGLFVDNLRLLAVPEPASMALMGIGLASVLGLAAARPRRTDSSRESNLDSARCEPLRRD